MREGPASRPTKDLPHRSFFHGGQANGHDLHPQVRQGTRNHDLSANFVVRLLSMTGLGRQSMRAERIERAAAGMSVRGGCLAIVHMSWGAPVAASQYDGRPLLG